MATVEIEFRARRAGDPWKQRVKIEMPLEDAKRLRKYWSHGTDMVWSMTIRSKVKFKGKRR